MHRVVAEEGKANRLSRRESSGSDNSHKLRCLPRYLPGQWDLLWRPCGRRRRLPPPSEADAASFYRLGIRRWLQIQVVLELWLQRLHWLGLRLMLLLWLRGRLGLRGQLERRLRLGKRL